jgi:twinkle protein
MNIIPDTIDFSQYMEETESHAVHPASHWLQETIDAFHAPEHLIPAPTLLWGKTRGDIHFRPGEVSLWAGINGHGKSMFLSHMTLDLCVQRSRVMVASFEMKPVRQMQRMSRQAYADSKPEMNFLNKLARWTDDKLWIYDHVGAVEWRKLLAVMRYAVKNFGINHFVLDSLMKCVKGEDDYNAQKDFVTELCAFAAAHNVHVHLVHHVRKGEHEGKPPGKFDIKGSGSITDQVDNVFIVWRNKKAEDECKDLPPGTRSASPNCMFACEKQRNGEKEGKYGFWFDPYSQQYLEHVDTIPMRYELK